MYKTGILKMKYLILIIVAVNLMSCTKEYNYEVDEELIPFFRIFEEEALLRGQTYDLDLMGIGGMIEFIRDNNTAGQCQTSDEGNKRVFIDRSFWEQFDYDTKEFLVFHELGHCVLGRTHDDSTFGNNICVSIMQSGTSGCRNNYKSSTRSDYLDELFNK